MLDGRTHDELDVGLGVKVDRLVRLLEGRQLTGLECSVRTKAARLTAAHPTVCRVGGRYVHARRP